MKLIVDDKIKCSPIVEEITTTLNSASCSIVKELVVGIYDCGCTYRGERKVEVWFLNTGDDDYEMGNQYEEFSRLLEDNIKLYCVETKCHRGAMYVSVIWDRSHSVCEEGYEDALLSAMMQNEDSWKIHEICDDAGLSKEDFYDKKHQEIFRAIENLVLADRTVNAEYVTEELKELGTLDEVGGKENIERLERSGRVGYGLDTAKWWIEGILKKSANRKLIRKAEERNNEGKRNTEQVISDVLYGFRKEVSDLSDATKDMSFRLRELEKDQYGAHCVLQRCEEIINAAKKSIKKSEEICTEVNVTYGKYGWAVTFLHVLAFTIIYSVLAGIVIEFIKYL